MHTIFSSWNCAIHFQQPSPFFFSSPIAIKVAWAAKIVKRQSSTLLQTHQRRKSHNSLLLFEEAKVAAKTSFYYYLLCIHTLEIVMAKMCIKSAHEPVFQPSFTTFLTTETVHLYFCYFFSLPWAWQFAPSWTILNFRAQQWRHEPKQNNVKNRRKIVK